MREVARPYLKGATVLDTNLKQRDRFAGVWQEQLLVDIQVNAPLVRNLARMFKISRV